MKHRSFTGKSEHGVALVTTVIVVAVLAVVAVAMMQSTTVDRLSSRSVANYYRAKLAAEAGAAVAQSLVADLVTRYPDSATVWQNIGGGSANGTNNEATVLYVRAQSANTNLGARPGQFGAQVALLAQPLVSRAGADPLLIATNLVPVSAVGSVLPFSAANMVNINATNVSRTEPFVGSRSGSAPVTAAQWIYLTKYPGTFDATTNPYVARYAFWIEDESFKVNVNTATNGPRGATSLGLSASEVRIDGSWSSSPALAGANFAEISKLRGNTAYPSPGAVPTALTAAVAAQLAGSNVAPEVRFLTTIHSAGLDLSRGGFKRVNVNTVTNGDKRTALDRITAAITNTNAAPNFGQRLYRVGNDPAGINSTNAVQANNAAVYLQKIAANIRDYVDSDDQPTVISNNYPAFALMTNRPSMGIMPLGGGTAGLNPVAAMGVENVPRLQEYAIHLRLRSMRHDQTNGDSFGFIANTNAGAVNPTQANYEIWLDHYFEFYNPGTRAYTNNPDAFLKIFDQPAWGPGPGGGVVVDSTGRGGGGLITSNNRASSEIPLIDAFTGAPVVFPAGEVTVLTTAPLTALNTGSDPNGVLVVTANPTALVPLANVPREDRVFIGTTTSIRNTNYNYTAAAAEIGGGADFGYNRLFEVALQFGRPGGTANTDYASGVFIGNNQGLIESHVGLPIGVTNGNSKFSAIVDSSYARNDLSHVGGNIPNGQIDNVRGGSLRGNANNGVSSAVTRPNSTEGDPRTLLEQLEFNLYTSGTDPNQTRFYNTMGPGSGPSSTFANNTFGRPNTNYVRAADWADSSSVNPGASNAPLILRNGPMQAIGELGHITDPARPYITAGSAPSLARGGGRTLRVGQQELTNSGGTNVAWFDGRQTNASRTWTSWRLADIFTTTSASNGATAADPLGSLTNSAGVVRGVTNANGAVVTIPGLINPNGALRDGGAALRAALFGFQFLPSPDGSPVTARRPIATNNLVNSVLSRMTNVAAAGLPANSVNVFWERGEISELPLFNSGNTLISGVLMSNAFDRGREEVVRRSIEMMTTRGSIFTAYAVGQALQVTGSTTNVLSTARTRTTFEIVPQFASPAVAMRDDFALSDASVRFASPTNYAVRVLSSSYD